MSLCACGRITNAARTTCDRCAALVALGLTSEATQGEIRDAYRTLAKVWHPDRFTGDEKLRTSAEEKLKEINLAYQLLTTTAAERIPGRPSSPDESHKQPPRSTSNKAPGTGPAPASGAGPDNRRNSNRFKRSPNTKRQRSKSQLALAFAVLVAGGTWITLRYAYPPRSQTSAGKGAPVRQMASSVIDNSQSQPAGKLVVGTGPRNKKQNQSRNQATASLLVFPPEDPRVPYFTVGSSKDDVVRVQGTPSRLTDTVFAYGTSEVYFKEGRVQSWRIDSSTPLKARLLPASHIEPQGYFTIGSSRDEVLAVQGTPSRFTDQIFAYGQSEVYFKDGRVASWRIDPASPLKVRLPSGD